MKIKQIENQIKQMMIKARVKVRMPVWARVAPTLNRPPSPSHFLYRALSVLSVLKSV